MSVNIYCCTSRAGQPGVTVEGEGVKQFAYETQYVGVTLCLCKEWNNSMGMDLTYAKVWDDTRGEIIEVSYYLGATVDATDEVKAKANRWIQEQCYQSAVARATSKAADVEKGKICVVARGRKVAKGTVVTVVSVSNRTDVFNGHTVKSVSALVRDAVGALFHINAANLDVQSPESYIPSNSELWRSVAGTFKGF